MSSGSPARWLAPLALCAAFLAVVFVVRGSTEDSPDRPAASSTEPREDRGATTGETTTTPETTSTPQTSTTETTATTTGDETYTVQSGDTLGTIAEETGIAVEELQELNPDVDSQALSVGDEIRLAR